MRRSLLKNYYVESLRLLAINSVFPYPEPGRCDKNPHLFDTLSMHLPTLVRTSLSINNIDLQHCLLISYKI